MNINSTLSILVGSATLTCQEDGTWSSDVPQCDENWTELVVGALRSFAAKSRAPPFLRIVIAPSFQLQSTNDPQVFERTRYLCHVTGYQPISDQYYLPITISSSSFRSTDRGDSMQSTCGVGVVISTASQADFRKAYFFTLGPPPLALMGSSSKLEYNQSSKHLYLWCKFKMLIIFPNTAGGWMQMTRQGTLFTTLTPDQRCHETLYKTL
eukprot:sb/3470223/